MSKDSMFVNQSEDHELNYLLKKYGLSESKENRKKLKDLLPPYTKTEDANELIKKNLANFDAKK
ncbi:hypothetical protein EV697_10314 [Bisgaardia hudsonensis]|uniref:Uncharacterized protein n=1 Tax=Bisgaardia hudsonensis TaxID=109472 RepID=A0A4R2MTK9_9PAST|nr:hypothetical protein [Bisgaardia hudsonensis]QLB13311.1 hypothetical protein A6A11_06690 [Bisgaardia hudsonensis]TCP12711.1 hypothetical protein EV697_10314 [Bisgaardia hudsonensis]